MKLRFPRPHGRRLVQPRNAARRDEGRRGTTAVEMALIAPVFFMMLMGITESTLMLAAQQVLENAAFNTSRLAKTGYTASGQNQSQTVSQEMVSELQAFGNLIDTTKVVITQSAYSSFSAIGSGSGTSGYGTASQIVVYNISYPWKLFTPMMSALMGTNGIVTLSSHIVVRNEPYG